MSTSVLALGILHSLIYSATPAAARRKVRHGGAEHKAAQVGWPRIYTQPQAAKRKAQRSAPELW